MHSSSSKPGDGICRAFLEKWYHVLPIPKNSTSEKEKKKIEKGIYLMDETLK